MNLVCARAASVLCHLHSCKKVVCKILDSSICCRLEAFKCCASILCDFPPVHCSSAVMHQLPGVYQHCHQLLRCCIRHLPYSLRPDLIRVSSLELDVTHPNASFSQKDS